MLLLDHVAGSSFQRSSSYDLLNRNIHGTSTRRRHAPRATAISFQMLLFTFFEFIDHVHGTVVVEIQRIRAAGGVPGPPGENEQSGQDEQDGGNGDDGQKSPKKVGQQPAPATLPAPITSVATTALPPTPPSSTKAPLPQMPQPSLAISSVSVLASSAFSTASLSTGSQTTPMAVTVTPELSSSPSETASLLLPTITTSFLMNPTSIISASSTESSVFPVSLISIVSSTSPLPTIAPSIGPSISPTTTIAASPSAVVAAAPQSPLIEKHNLAIILPTVFLTLLATLIISLLLTRCCTRRPYLAVPHLCLGLRGRTSLPIPDEETPPAAVENRRAVVTASTASTPGSVPGSVPTSQQTEPGASVFMSRFLSLIRHLPRAATPEPPQSLPSSQISQVQPPLQRREIQQLQQPQPQKYQNQRQNKHVFGLTLPPLSLPPPLRLGLSHPPLAQNPLKATTAVPAPALVSVPVPTMTAASPLPTVPRYIAFFSPPMSNNSLAASSPTSAGLSSRNESDGLSVAGADRDGDISNDEDDGDCADYYGRIRGCAPARFTFGGGGLGVVGAGAETGRDGDREDGVERAAGRAWSGLSNRVNERASDASRLGPRGSGLGKGSGE